MISKSLKAAFVCSIVLFSSCKDDKNSEENVVMTDTNNVLLQEWKGPYQGLPAFDKMNVTDIKEAVETGMTLGLEDIEAIANNTESPTFENTIVPLEASADELNDVFTYYGIMSSNMSSPEFRDIQGELAPKLSDYSSKISQNEKLFQRVKAVYDAHKKRHYQQINSVFLI